MHTQVPRAPRAVAIATAGLMALFALADRALAQDSAAAPAPYSYGKGTLFVPASSQPQKIPPGHKFAAHTNVELFQPAGLSPDEAPPEAGFFYETPASLACHYGLVTTSAAPNCNPNTTTVNPTGGSKTIAIVDAYDDPSAPGDLAWFSLQFGITLAQSQLEVVFANTAASS